MPPVEFEPTISADELPQTYALDRAATRGHWDRHEVFYGYKFFKAINSQYVSELRPAMAAIPMHCHHHTTQHCVHTALCRIHYSTVTKSVW